MHSRAVVLMVFVTVLAVANLAPVRAQEPDEHSVRHCSAQDLDAWTRWSRVAHGTVAGAVYFMNRTAEVCALHGSSVVDLVIDSGDVLPVEHPGYRAPHDRILLLDEQQAQVRFWWYAPWCRPDSVGALHVRLPDGSTLDAPAHEQVTPDCPGNRSFPGLMSTPFEPAPTPPVYPGTPLLDCYQIVPRDRYLIRFFVPQAWVDTGLVDQIERAAHDLASDYHLSDVVTGSLPILFGGFAATIPPELVEVVGTDGRVQFVVAEAPRIYTAATLPPEARGVASFQRPGTGYVQEVSVTPCAPS
jgi:hypothetical protein